MFVVAAAAPASAQPVDVSTTIAGDGSSPAPQPLGYAAMPGGLHAPSADTLPKGTVAISALGAYGRRSGLLGGDHQFGRGIGDLAFAIAPTDMLTLALALDGRYDKHTGLAADDDGYVGDPRILARVAKPFGSVKLGAQVGIWVPGKDAPSVAASAISVDARALLSVAIGRGSLSFDAGFRLDNSAKSVDKPGELSLQDRVSLGVSEFHAAVGGIHLTIPAGGKAFVGAEASIDFFVGTDAPGPVLRGGIHGGIHVTPQFSIIAFAELAKVPAIDADDVMANDITLIAYEPAITGGLGLQARFGGRSSKPRPFLHPDNPIKRDIAVIVYAELTGTVTDEHGKPVVGAKVSAKLKNITATAVTDEKGNYKIAKVPIGKTVNGATTLDDTGAEVAVAVDGKKPATTTVTLAQGANTIAKLTLEPMLPPGQLKVVVRAAATGRAIANATITIEPGGRTATSGADGTLSIDLAPGTYKATATAPGHAPQTLDVTVDPHGVAIKNFELSR